MLELILSVSIRTENKWRSDMKWTRKAKRRSSKTVGIDALKSKEQRFVRRIQDALSLDLLVHKYRKRLEQDAFRVYMLAVLKLCYNVVWSRRDQNATCLARMM